MNSIHPEGLWWRKPWRKLHRAGSLCWHWKRFTDCWKRILLAKSLAFLPCTQICSPYKAETLCTTETRTEAVNLERLSCPHRALLHTDWTSRRLVQIWAAPTPAETAHNLGLRQIPKRNFLGKAPVCSTTLPSAAPAKAVSSPSPPSSSLENDVL